MSTPERLWAPWRMAFIENNNDDNECVFCVKDQDPADDAKKFILYRGKHSFVILNLYPYNCSHLMVSPYRHIANYEELTQEEVLEIAELTQKSISAIKEVCRPEGFNVGLNLGKAAGAGIAGHIHQHVVPRWTGDTNFLPVLSGGTRSLPEYLTETYNKLIPFYS